MSSLHSDSRTSVGEYLHPAHSIGRGLAIPAVLLLSDASLAAAHTPAATEIEAGAPAATLARTGDAFGVPKNTEARLTAQSRVIMAKRGATASVADGARSPGAVSIAEPVLLLLVASGFFLVSRSLRARVGRGWLSIRSDRVPLRRP